MHQIKNCDIQAFSQYLKELERSPATIEKYRSSLERLYAWLPVHKCIDKETIIRYKEQLTMKFAPAGVNTTLAALNGFFRFVGWPECVVKPLHIQRQAFICPEKELDKEEYKRLVNAARRKKDTRLELLLQLMASTGMRVSEIQYVTVDAIAKKMVSIRLKGKVRTVLLPDGLCSQLQSYQKRNRIASGPIFLTRSGKVMDRKEIWAQMKRLCRSAGVSDTKVFPHNLRHLFARSFYAKQKDISKLADVLGHSSIDTTRIYLVTSGQEHRQIINNLQLLC